MQTEHACVLKLLAVRNQLLISYRNLQSILIKNILVVKDACSIGGNRQAVSLSVVLDPIQHVRLHVLHKILIRQINEHVVVDHFLENRIGSPVAQDIRHIAR